MDISQTLAPKSDQMDYEDLISGPLTLTVTEVRRGPSTEQPVEIAFEEFDRPWRPAKTVRRVLVACWGADSGVYVGRRVTLYGDPAVTWAGEAVGGIRLSHASDISAPVTVSLTIRRGKRAPFVVEPLPPARQQETVERIINHTPADDVLVDEWTAAFKAASTLAQLQTEWTAAVKAGVTTDQRVVEAKDKRKEELS